MNKRGVRATYYLFILVLFAISASAHTTIRMTDTGFDPSKVEIEGDTTVTFINVGNNSHWPASNIHPTHAIYPEFDPKKEILPKDSWSFTFDKAGEWRMHDHLYPELTGVITVTGENEQPGFFARIIAAIKKIFSGTTGMTSLSTDPKNNESITENASGIYDNDDILYSYIKKFGIGKTMSRLINESKNGSSFECHQQAHHIGRVGYQIENEKAFQSCDASCHSGCYHGAMEQFIREKGTANLSTNIDALCSSFGTKFGVFECIHGTGHGVLAYLDYDMPGALDECKKLKDSWSQTSCYGGVFMENILTGQGLGAGKNSHQTAWVNKTDPHFPCSGIQQDYDIQYQCYMMQTSWMLTINDYNFSNVAKLCQKAPAEMVQVCFRGYGREAAGNVLRDPKKILALCGLVPNEKGHYEECIIGAVNVIIDFWGPSLKDQASQLCKLVSEPAKKSCYNTLALRLKELVANKSDQQAICQTFELEYKASCGA